MRWSSLPTWSLQRDQISLGTHFSQTALLGSSGLSEIFYAAPIVIIQLLLFQIIKPLIWLAHHQKNHASLDECYHLHHLLELSIEQENYEVWVPRFERWENFNFLEDDIVVKPPGIIIIRHLSVPESRLKNFEVLKEELRDMFRSSNPFSGELV